MGDSLLGRLLVSDGKVLCWLEICLFSSANQNGPLQPLWEAPKDALGAEQPGRRLEADVQKVRIARPLVQRLIAPGLSPSPCRRVADHMDELHEGEIAQEGARLP